MSYQQVLVRLGLPDRGACLAEFRLGGAPFTPRGFDVLDIRAGVAVKQRPVPTRIDQTAIVMLAVQLDQSGSQFAQQRGADRLIVDERLARPIGLQRPAQDQRLARLDLDVGLRQHLAHSLRQFAELERRGDARPLLARAQQPAFGTIAEHQPECVEQDRLARPGLAGEHAEPARKGQVERVDQHDVADGEPGQHAGTKTLGFASPGRNAHGAAITALDRVAQRRFLRAFPQVVLSAGRHFPLSHQGNFNGPMTFCG